MESRLKKEIADFLGNVASLTLLTQQLAFIRGFAIMAADAIGKSRIPKFRTFRELRMVGLHVQFHMASWDHDRVPFDGLRMHNPGVAGGTAFTLAPLGKSLQMFAVAHDKTNIFDWRR